VANLCVAGRTTTIAELAGKGELCTPTHIDASLGHPIIGMSVRSKPGRPQQDAHGPNPPGGGSSTQGLGKVPECRFHELVMPITGRLHLPSQARCFASAPVGNSIRDSGGRLIQGARDALCVLTLTRASARPMNRW
jgi:hypothetical protein